MRFKADRREFWIGWDGVNGGSKYVMDKRPSGISGGGSMISIHVTETYPADRVLTSWEVRQLRGIIDKLARADSPHSTLDDLADMARAILDDGKKKRGSK